MSSLQIAPAMEEPPPEFLCPITLDLMRDPVAAPTGITYDRAAINSWLLAGGQRTCPITHGKLRAADLVPNHTLGRLIQQWCAVNRPRGGVEQAIAATSEEVAVADVEEATRAGDADRCVAAARWVRRLAGLGERSRRRLASAGAARALAAAFASFTDAASDVLEGILAALVLMGPKDEEAIVVVSSSSASVARLVAAAADGGPQRRLHAVVVIREIISQSFHRYGAGAINLSANADAIVQVLVKTIRDAICPRATRACLVAARHLAYAAGEGAAALLVVAAIVPVIVELLVDADRSTAEKALAALDAALVSRDGRVCARADALAVPGLVKKILCVSVAATELVLSVLLRIGKKCPEDDEDATMAAGRRLAIIEALQVGALQKVLLLLQAGCRVETKEKATELLRLMVRYQSRVECVDTMDFRGIKRGTTILTT